MAPHSLLLKANGVLFCWQNLPGWLIQHAELALAFGVIDSVQQSIPEYGAHFRPPCISTGIFLELWMITVVFLPFQQQIVK
jgi:hypothetical protein